MLGLTRLWKLSNNRPILTGANVRRNISHGGNFIENLMARDLVANVTR